jgi:hypothetical protein
MLQDLIMDLLTAGDEKDKERAYRRLERVGVDRKTADVMAAGYCKEERKETKVVDLTEALRAKAEELDWSLIVCDDGSIELEAWSPAGKDLCVTLTSDDPVREMREYADNFDADEHVEMWVESRGRRGVPSSVRALVEDAEEIREMLNALAEGFELVREKAKEHDER